MARDPAVTFHRTQEGHLAVQFDRHAMIALPASDGSLSGWSAFNIDRPPERWIRDTRIYNRRMAMPKFTIETTYHLPVYRKRIYRAATLEAACHLAIDDDGWGDAKEDVETSGETYVTGIWFGEDTENGDEIAEIPSQYRETVQRKAEHFHELLDQLAHVAQPMGPSHVDFECWLPKAMAAVEKAKAIIDERRDPDAQNEPSG